MTLKDYQIEDHKILDDFGQKGILAYEMGMGKTAGIITYVSSRKLFPCIIVCPPSAFDVFQTELRKWIDKGKLVIINNGNACDIPIVPEMFVLLTYGVLSKWIDHLKRINPESIIWDEAHKFANTRTKRNQAVRNLAKSVRSNFFLTGSVFNNNVDELFTMLNILNSHEFPDVETVREYHESGILFDTLKQKYMIRKLKEDYLNLPKKERKVIPIEIDNRDDYDKAENDFISWLIDVNEFDSDTKIHAFAKMEKLKQIAVKGKLKAIENFLRKRSNSEAKTLIYFTHKFPLEFIQQTFGQACVSIQGRTTRSGRQKAEQLLMKNPAVWLFAGNIRAAGESLTLTAANMVTFGELPWTSAACDQVEDRAHRLSQTRKVTVIYFIATHTIEERIIRIIDAKRILSSETLDGKRPKDGAILLELLNEYRGENCA